MRGNESKRVIERESESESEGKNDSGGSGVWGIYRGTGNFRK